jgi:glycosyltransferase involved in cell wall biosynthesis
LNTDLLWVPHYNAPLLYTGRLVVTIHDVCHLALPESLGSSVKRSYARLLFANVARRADAIFCVSEFTALEVQRYLHVMPTKIHVTRPGLDARWNINAEPYTDPKGFPYFLYVGNVKPNKNLRGLLEAFRQIMHQIPHRLVIVGKLGNMKSIDEAVIAEARSMPERVHLTGEISDERLMQYYRGAAAFVFPSLYEGFGLPLLEAMSLKCPVLCSNTSSLPEVAGSAALYFDPLDSGDLAEKLLEIVSSAALRTSLVEEGLARVKKFSYERCAEQTAEVLNRILLEKKR